MVGELGIMGSRRNIFITTAIYAILLREIEPPLLFNNIIHDELVNLKDKYKTKVHINANAYSGVLRPLFKIGIHAPSYVRLDSPLLFLNVQNLVKVGDISLPNGS